jgi:2-iminobutanoate/2-iminopropanoate deaminase
LRLERVLSEGAPKPIGPYSQAVICGDLVFCSGQIGLDPASGDLVGDEVVAQAERVMLNLKAVLEAAGANPSTVVRTTLYLVDITDFSAVNNVYARHFGDAKPARSTVAVASLPRGAKVEMDAIAFIPVVS